MSFVADHTIERGIAASANTLAFTDTVSRFGATGLAINFAPVWQRHVHTTGTLKKDVPQFFLVSMGKTIEEKFSQLCNDWRKETFFHSFVAQKIQHPAHKEIVAMGNRAVPLILRELALNGGHWFYALETITGENPVPMADRGDTKKMKVAWLQWGRLHAVGG